MKDFFRKIFELFINSDPHSDEKYDRSTHKENFSVLQLTLSDGKPALGSIDYGYANFKHKKRYRYFLDISIIMDPEKLTDAGFPDVEESPVILELEDELKRRVDQVADAVYVGHLYNKGMLDVFMYLDSPDKVKEHLDIFKDGENRTRDISYEIYDDPKWREVSVFMDLK